MEKTPLKSIRKANKIDDQVYLLIKLVINQSILCKKSY